jgi:molybdate transport system substrate-binding protein
MRLLLLLNLSAMLSTIYLAALTIAAASDLAPLADSLVSASPIRPVTWSFGSSGQLRRQIEAGAPFDLYLSANEEYVRQLEQSGHLLKGSVRVYAQGQLGWWCPSRKLTGINDLLKPEIRRIALPNPAHAPYGAAAVEMLKRAGVYDKLRDKLVFGENVRQAYEFARTGNVDTVITSWTLLQNTPDAALVPTSLYPSIRQAGGVVANSRLARQAQAFLEFLLSPAGQGILRKGGLGQP